MNILLDTCAWLWALYDSEKLKRTARALILDEFNTVYVSPISFWELGVKQKKDPKIPSFDRLKLLTLQQGFEFLPLELSDIRPLRNLPDIHKDPFDRLLICQAINNSCGLVTNDEKIHQYPIKVIWD